MRKAPASATQAPSIDALHDIVVPEPVSWLPATTAWYVLLASLAIGLLAAAWLGWRRHRANRYRREALARLDDVEAALADPNRRAAALAALPVLTKRVALVIGPRVEVAALSGEPWLAYLDGTYGGDGFRHGPGQLLPGISYAAPEALEQIPDEQIHGLTELLRAWVRGHRRDTSAASPDAARPDPDHVRV